ncbi:hypothetical protein ACFVUH_24100 [Kitasatospora sp. NPDC058032]|uniref:hypothetical protein n=1 Tax=Kitasatospora sp. NPDC058032 TaxID=3346307 RepID=UPI0036DBAE4A
MALPVAVAVGPAALALADVDVACCVDRRADSIPGPLAGPLALAAVHTRSAFAGGADLPDLPGRPGPLTAPAAARGETAPAPATRPDHRGSGPARPATRPRPGAGLAELDGATPAPAPGAAARPRPDGHRRGGRRGAPAARRTARR